MTYLATTRKTEGDQFLQHNLMGLDLSDLTSISNFVEIISEFKFKKIIYCVGATSDFRYETVQFGEIQKYFTVHNINAFYLIVKLCQLLDDEVLSTLAVISSRAAIYPSFDFSYSASKAALSSFVSSLSRQLPSHKRTIVFAPGALLNSRMFYEMPTEIQKSHMERSQGELLSVDEAAMKILTILESKFTSGAIVEIGPSYT